MQIQDRAGAYGEEKRRIFAQQKKDKKEIKKNCVQPEAYGRTVKSQMGISDAFGYFIFAGGGSIFGKCPGIANPSDAGY